MIRSAPDGEGQMRALVQFAGDDQPQRPRNKINTKRLTSRASNMFRLGSDTAAIALALDAHEARVLKRVTLERCKRLGLPSPYGGEE